jgi:HK97 family phage major capsid protein
MATMLEQIESLKTEGREIAAKGADMSDTEGERLTAINGELGELVKKSEKAIAAKKALTNFGALKDDEQAEVSTAKSLGEHFVKTAGESMARLKSFGTVVSAPEFVKAAGDPSLIGNAFDLATQTVDLSIVQAYRRPLVSSILGAGSMAGNNLVYYVESTMEGAPGSVAEGATKPGLTFDPASVMHESLHKIAAYWKTSTEMAEDTPFWVSEINGRGVYNLQLIEEQQLLNGDGTGTNLLGILNRSGIQTLTQASGDSVADTIFKAATAIQTARGLNADGIVINPLDWQAIRLSKDGNGQYFGGGPLFGQYGNPGFAQTDGTQVSQSSMWGYPTIVTQAVPQGTVVVGAFKLATTVYRHNGLTVESTTTNEADFINNLITTRVEERLALAVRIPNAIVKVTLA